MSGNLFKTFLTAFIVCWALTGAALSFGDEIAGTFYGEPVSRQNYFFVLKTVLTYNSPWGGIPRSREQLKRRIWDELLLSYEAHRREISVEEKEVERKISALFEGHEVSFDWRKEKNLYKEWIKENLGVSTDIFENQMRHLVKIQKLHELILNNVDDTVTEEEAFQEFLNEYNSLSVEVVEFDKREEAREFYDQVKKDPSAWEKKKKEDQKKDREDKVFRRPGFVALEFLINMWGFPKDAVYEMIEMETGAVHPPEPIYEGYGVFKILEIRRADESEFPKRRKSYYDQLERRKRYQGFDQWLEDLKDDADVQVFMDLPPDIIL